jgi:hypothetical protein
MCPLLHRGMKKEEVFFLLMKCGREGKAGFMSRGEKKSCAMSVRISSTYSITKYLQKNQKFTDIQNYSCGV